MFYNISFRKTVIILNLKDFYFELPQELVAQEPLKNRSASRLLTLNRNNGDTTHKNFTDIIDLLNPNDCLVINNTKVMPARLFGKTEKGNVVEFLLLQNSDAKIWEVLVRPGKWARIGEKLSFGDLLQGEIIDINEDGNRFIKFDYNGNFENILDALGEMPLPPYIHRKLEDKDRYQTVYASELGSAAAPTAGLHFTNQLLDNIKQKGVSIAYVTLHVGLGTFRPVSVENIKEHKMHSEYYILENSQADIMNTARQNGGRVVACGTTSMRTLESCCDNDGKIIASSGYTDIFIYPGYTFKAVDALITNFHMPESTLVMLVSAFSTRDYIMQAYSQAIKERYRFFSFGDSMFIH